MSDAEKKPRSVEEIEAEIQRTRLAMQSTVDELTGRLDPREQVKTVKEKAKAGAEDFSRRAQAAVEDAKEGDPTALATLASIATGVVLVAGIAIWRRR
ncbi:MAG: DUF3618 domain-containing protein [Actinomycetaceae bacterium]|nr:DUF3618 domain-containing protein [Actinomycetaceae bacterium]